MELSKKPKQIKMENRISKHWWKLFIFYESLAGDFQISECCGFRLFANFGLFVIFIMRIPQTLLFIYT